jgi:hypothetical protein
MATATDREKVLETALAQIDRQFGKGSVMRLGSEERAPVEVIPTGSIALDVALGIGGLPRRPRAASRRSSTQSMRSTPSTPASWASTSIRSSYRSPTRVSRRSRSPTC